MPFCKFLLLSVLKTLSILPSINLGPYTPTAAQFGWRAMCSIWKTLNPLPQMTFWIRWNSCFLAPTPTPGPIGPPWELSLTSLVLHIRRYLNTTFQLFYFWIWKRCYFKICTVLVLGGLPWTPLGATCTIWTTLNPWPLRMIPAKFG